MNRFTRTLGTVLLAVLCAGVALAAPAAKPAKVVLPSWAPRKPSPEFLRAAAVLRPIPEEAQDFDPTYVPAYELFGTLSEKQRAEFLTRKQISMPARAFDARTREGMKRTYGATEAGGTLTYYRHELQLPVKSLTPAQRKAFDRLLAVWGQSARESGQDDTLVGLYRMGARRDLSNVDLAFTTMAAHAVHLMLYVTVPTGEPGRVGTGSTGFWFAQLGASGPTVKVDLGGGGRGGRGGGGGGGGGRGGGGGE